MVVKIKRLHPDAVTPYKTYEDDFCYDVVATSVKQIAPRVFRYGIGLAFQIDRDKENPLIHKITGIGGSPAFKAEMPKLSIDFRPRSSVWKTGMVLSNCEGTIDEIFRGEVSAVFYHVLPDLPRYEVGDRIGQIKIGMTLPMEFVEVEELTKTARGDGGYGSTGK